MGREKTMRGSEKQIKWATEIRDNVIKTYTEAIPILEDLAPNLEAYEKVKQLLTARIELLKDENIHAGDIIDIFKDIRFNGDKPLLPVLFSREDRGYFIGDDLLVLSGKLGREVKRGFFILICHNT